MTRHHLRVVSAIRAWLWYWYGFGRPSLKREVQLDFRVHSSSCGAQCGVVHSPFEWLDHRYHCNCRYLVLFVGSLPCCGVFASRCRVVVVFFTPDGAYDSVWDSVKPMTGKYILNYFQYQEFVGCVCMLNYCFSSNDEICPDNYNYSRFKLKDKCRSEKWELYLYGDMTIMVERAQVQFLDSGDMPVVVTTGHRVQTCRQVCFPTVAVLGSSWFDGMTF